MDLPIEIQHLSLEDATAALNLAYMNVDALIPAERPACELRMTQLRYHIAVLRQQRQALRWKSFTSTRLEYNYEDLQPEARDKAFADWLPYCDPEHKSRAFETFCASCDKHGWKFFADGSPVKENS